jgi:hypothetical protein
MQLMYKSSVVHVITFCFNQDVVFSLKVILDLFRVR